MCFLKFLHPNSACLSTKCGSSLTARCRFFTEITLSKVRASARSHLICVCALEELIRRLPPAHLGRVTEDTPEHQGVVIYSMSDIPLVNIKFGLSVCMPFFRWDDADTLASGV